ncbi:MAG: glutamate synthase subunit beta [Archangium sp.]
MGHVTGFMEWERQTADKREVEERVKDSKEFVLPLLPEDAKKQAGRCMDCGVPFCHRGCPLGNPIPEFNDHVFNDRWKKAWEVLSTTNDFPEFTGRLCPAPCEGACVLAIDQGAVTIEQMEKEIIERAFAEGWVVPRIPMIRTGKKVAVVGSGPAGLGAAARLNQLGHSVTVFERADRIGGLLRYGIPDFKMEKHVIDRRLALLEAEGIVFKTGVDVGVSPTWTELKAEHDALVIAIGAARPRVLDVPGVELDGVMLAMNFLEGANRGGPASARGKNVVILGGGDTGSDCLGTALRQGAATVKQVELMPALGESRSAAHPWPEWPLIFRTSSSQEEGGARVFARRTTKLEGEGGKLKALHWTDAQKSDGEERVEVDLLIQAMGFVGPVASSLRDQLGIELDARGNVKVDAQFRTNVPGVFAAGDAKRGASLIVWAIAEGRDLAKCIFS